MKIKSLFTCMMISLVTILPLQAQVGKEMKAFRNKDGTTVTMLNPHSTVFINKEIYPYPRKRL